MAGRSAERDADGAGETAHALTVLAPRLLAAVALLLATANVLAGLVYRAGPESAGDFHVVILWCRAWLRGEPLYEPFQPPVVYPPNALVTLAPLALLATPHALALWMGLHVALSAAAAALSSRLMAARAWAMPFGIAVLTLPPFRIPLQFSLLSFVAALSGIVAAGRYPRIAGVAIGLSLMKPQIGGPALLWAVAARRWRTAGWAMAVPAGLLLVYAIRAMASPFAVVPAWVQSVARMQNRADLLPGEANLQPLVAFDVMSPLAVQMIVAGLAAAGLVYIWLRPRDDFDQRFFAAACLVSLLAVRHLSYDLLLVIPALAFCFSRGTPTARILGALSLVILAASPPSLWRHYVEPRFLETPIDPLAVHAYRVVGLCLFAFVVSVPARPREPRATI